ncbi:hypothetical protein ACVRXQ_01175 [Streptococcus panodentis]|uniref:Uncharacterized protein n=1 Tax=Streptococcus panodentis TaxID=1581472 RepID=A0ABS5AT96_9STRE|nr:hypothetical protein [Streptococcus panodentis]MBP2619799.1 hypothetical protein [Streptococcus panodentis]
MFTLFVFIVSLILLLRRFKSRRSRIIIGMLYSLFLVWYVQAILNYGKYTLQPGQSVQLRVSPNTNQVEFSSELILDKKDSGKLKLTGLSFWTEIGKREHYDVEETEIYETVFIDGKIEHKKLPNSNNNSMYIGENGFIVQYKGGKRFNVTSGEKYTITITNIDNKPAHFEAQVVDR